MTALRQRMGVAATTATTSTTASTRHTPSPRRIPPTTQYDRAEILLRELDRVVTLPRLCAECASVRQQVQLERKAHDLLEHAADEGQDDAEIDHALATLTNPDLLEFHLRRLREVRQPNALGLVLRALSQLKSPRIAPAVARAFPDAVDAECAALMRDILTNAPPRPRVQCALWDEAYDELEQALSDPRRATPAAEALALLRGDTTHE